jgi:beta-phosphoglucomutase-like phosphatase (HAD superfamily)
LAWGSSSIEAVIFDSDGTIADWVDLHAEAWKRFLQDSAKTVLSRWTMLQTKRS